MEIRPIRILLLSDFSREPERILLRGLMQYASGHGGCLLFPMPEFMFDKPEFSSYIIKRAKELNVDAIFGRWGGIDEKQAASLGIPIVLRTHRKEHSEFPMLSGNYRLIGQKAAEFFKNEHYTSYAYFGKKGLIWSDERKEGFRLAVQADKIDYSELLVDDVSSDWNKIASWIASLPKPVAIFAANDTMARPICEICMERRIQIPEQVAILGVDDDEFLCNITYPALSSIHLEFKRQGMELGKAIFEMVHSGTITDYRIPIEPSYITERNSTLKHNISDKYVKQIVDFIDNAFSQPIKMSDIIGDIPLSARAIEIRFKTEMGPHTILSYLASQRVKHMCFLLRTSDLPISEVARLSGFEDVLNVGRVFRKQTGMSPSEYKQRFKP